MLSLKSVRTVVVFSLLAFLASAVASASIIEFNNKGKTVEIQSYEFKSKTWVDIQAISKSLGGEVGWLDKALVVTLPTHTFAIDRQNASYSILRKGERKWSKHSFHERVFYTKGFLLVPLESLPQLFQTSLSYHVQKRVLRLQNETTRNEEYRSVKVPFEIHDGKPWIKLESIASALNVTLFSSQADRFKIILPDFKILELQVGETYVTQKGLYARMPDPLLSFSGSPYLSLDSVPAVFGITARWDAANKMLLLPARYGRLREIKQPGPYVLNWEGYRPSPFHFGIDELVMFHQEPEPVFAAGNEDIYESVRDPLTDDPIKPDDTGFKTMSGRALLDTSGHTFGIPFEGRGSFEKMGSHSHVVNGTMKWGFPMFRIQGGREYTTFGGLNNQFNRVDQVSLSHSNDHFGDGNIFPRFQARATYGELDFSVFLSTSLFFQTVDYKQSFVSGALEGSWKFEGQKNLNLKLESFYFTNKKKGISASFYDEDLLKELFGNVAVDPAEQSALADTVLSDHHMTSLLTTDLKLGPLLSVGGVGGVSSYQSKEDFKNKMDSDWLVQSTIGSQKRRIFASFERAGPEYRSIGSPFRYQDRKIYRAAPYLDFGRYWKLYGDYRKEDIGILRKQGGAPYTNTYTSGSNVFSFPKHVFRFSAFEFDSSLYGRRVNGDFQYTRYLGRHSVDAGIGQGTVWTGTTGVFRRALTARGGFNILPSWGQFSLGEEYTWTRYPVVELERYESVSTLLVQFEAYKLQAQYQREPKYYLDPTDLYTGSIRVGRRVAETKTAGFFYSMTSTEPELHNPLVWRVGFELTYDF